MALPDTRLVFEPDELWLLEHHQVARLFAELVVTAGPDPDPQGSNAICWRLQGGLILWLNMDAYRWYLGMGT